MSIPMGPSMSAGLSYGEMETEVGTADVDISREASHGRLPTTQPKEEADAAQHQPHDKNAFSGVLHARGRLMRQCLQDHPRHVLAQGF